MDRSIESMTDEVVEWVDELLPNRSPFDTAIKLVEESSELLHALHHKGDVKQELADCFILLLDIAFLECVDLQKAFEMKMMVNRGRFWIAKQGTLQHIEEPDENSNR